MFNIFLFSFIGSIYLICAGSLFYCNKNNKLSEIGILLDTQGPEIRTGDTSLPIDLKVGDKVTLTVRDEVDVETSSIKVNYKGLIHSVDVGSKISVDNGLISFKVLSKQSENLIMKTV